MSLNKILLSARLIADLYPASLIEQFTPIDIPETIKFLGNNKKNILVLVSKNSIAFLEDNELDFLSSILLACKLSLADVAIVNVQSLSVANYQSVITQLKSKVLLMFDVASDAIDLPFNYPYFQVQQFDQCTYLSAPDLKSIEPDKTLKTQLWNCLKKLFGI